VAENISVKGSGADTGGGFNDVTYTPPDCWLQPDFTQPQTYTKADPTGSPSDAASYWFWFGNQANSWGFEDMLNHVQVGNGMNGTEAVLHQFHQEQSKKRPAGWTGPDPITSSDMWWVPNWLNTPGGFACAENLIGDNLSDGYLGMFPPTQPGAGGPQSQMITSQDLAELARAALQLPKPTIVTSPPLQSAVVNLPMDVSVVYTNGTNLTSIATLDLDGAPWLSATVNATLSSVQIQSSTSAYTATGFGDTGQTCAADAGNATSACTITFQAPSGDDPYSITVTENWNVSWTTSAGGGNNFPPAQSQPATRNVTVKEIQSAT
jgi:hypothetical protein